ncbi:DUF5330 domain-containing protein [Stappia sp.]|uniref:DUF5330 domain-containing protein n=1 Tax=Stappia sp. TaxID=1870903 RepID=UPI0032D8B713
MFFLLRSAFWIGLVLLLLPIDTGSDTEQTSPGVSPVAAFVAAQSTLSDLSGFCERNPETCATGGQAIAQIGARAKVSAQALYEFIDEHDDGQTPGAATQAPSGDGLTTGATGTLTPADLEPEWALELPETMPSASRPVTEPAPGAAAVPHPKPRSGAPSV